MSCQGLCINWHFILDILSDYFKNIRKQGLCQIETFFGRSYPPPNFGEGAGSKKISLLAVREELCPPLFAQARKRGGKLTMGAQKKPLLSSLWVLK